MLNGQKVCLRERRDEDEPVLYEIAAELETWEQRRATAPAPMTRAEFHTVFAEPTPSTVTRFVITVDERVVGTCNLFDEDMFARHAELGLGLLPEARGRGFGTDAMRVLVDFGFTRRNLHRIHLGVLATNAPALACYAKVGFVEEGRLRQHAWVRGRYVDEVKMGLLRSEWSSPLPG